MRKGRRGEGVRGVSESEEKKTEGDTRRKEMKEEKAEEDRAHVHS